MTECVHVDPLGPVALDVRLDSCRLPLLSPHRGINSGQLRPRLTEKEKQVEWETGSFVPGTRAGVEFTYRLRATAPPNAVDAP